jgi:DNA-binding NtrC family response regulator
MTNKTIAWIEDDIDIIDPVVMPLRNAGFQIDEYRNYEEAKSQFDKICAADLVLLDILIPPGRNNPADGEYLGLNVLDEMNERHVKMPIIVLSVVANRVQVEWDKYQLTLRRESKPIRPSKLKTIVFELLGLSNT